MTAIVREHLEAVAGSGEAAVEPPLVAYARGLVTREDAMASMGLRDYASLLAALGQEGLAPPRPSPHEVENQAAAFERIWKSA